MFGFFLILDFLSPILFFFLGRAEGYCNHSVHACIKISINFLCVCVLPLPLRDYQSLILT